MAVDINALPSRQFGNPRTENSEHPQCFSLKYRPNSTDERVLKEVIDLSGYRRKNIDFDVKPGEKWLDLGANIGAFAAYACIKGADHVDCFEPDPDCHAILVHNLACMTGRFANCSFSSQRKAVTIHKETSLPFYKGVKENDFYRNTICKTRQPHPSGMLPNIHAGLVFATDSKHPDPGHPKFGDHGVFREWDGCKMDIEGSEFGLIDAGTLPKCKKLVLEYHLSRDKELKNFRRRREILKKHFDHVHYLPSLDQAYPDDRYPGMFDRLIFCWNT